MANQIFRDHVIKNIRGAMQEYSNAAMVDHPGLKGHIREIALTNMFKPILPLGVDIGNGKIIDYTGNQSREIDIIIYTKKILAPILYDIKFGIFPIESCLYSIEVKSKITSSEIKDTISKALKLRSLKYIYEKYGQFISPVIPAIYAFDTDLELDGKSEIDRYKECDELFYEDPIIPVICVARRGYWWFNQREKIWTFHLPSAEFDEVIDFLGGVINTVPDIISKRGETSLGWYLMEPARKVFKIPSKPVG